MARLHAHRREPRRARHRRGAGRSRAGLAPEGRRLSRGLCPAAAGPDRAAHAHPAASRAGDRFLAETDAGAEYRASSVVIATGAFQEPIVPPCARQFAPDVVQLTAATYRHPGPLRGSRVLVVGDGATGRQLALELAGVSDVWLATGRRRVVTAQRILGRDQLWWSEKLGFLRASRRSLIGKLVRRLTRSLASTCASPACGGKA
jgi:cation diffusion facilitator CzcD-associated flavoprotein CzcO